MRAMANIMTVGSPAYPGRNWSLSQDFSLKSTLKQG
jgi:hypothetical protein